MKLQAKILYAALIAVLPAPLYAQDLPGHVRPADYPFARIKAIGGAHVGIDGDLSSIFINPAALASAKSKKTFVKLSVDVNNIDLIYRMLLSGEQPNLGDLFNERFQSGVDIGGPVALGIANKNYGLGIFNVTRIGLEWERNDFAHIFPTLTEEIILAGGYGLRLYDGPKARLDLGLTGKIFARAGYESQPLPLPGVKYIFQDLAEKPFETQIGGGFDAGFRWTLGDSLSFAAVVYDPYSPVWLVRYARMEKVNDKEMAASGVVPVTPRLSAGVSWSLNPEYLNHIFSGVTLSCDYKEMLDSLFKTSRDPLLNIGAGI